MQRVKKGAGRAVALWALLVILAVSVQAARSAFNPETWKVDVTESSGIWVPTWKDADCERLLKGVDDVGAVVWTKEPRDLKAHEAPKKWLRCDGSVLDTSRYSKLAGRLGRRFCHSEDGKELIRLPSLDGFFVYDDTIPGLVRLMSTMNIRDEFQEAREDPVSDPKDQQAIEQLAKDNKRNMKLVAYICAEE
jgi:hypothetical protein